MVGNRTKRIFNDAVGKRAALNSENGFRQIYYRDTGEEIWDISSPVYVRGRHWGGFRVGVSLEKIKEARNRMVMSIVIVISLIMIVSFISVFFTVNKALKPLRRLTQIASQLADGDVTKKIKSESEDETGQLSEALERLRMSLYFAMKKLNSGKEKKSEPQKTKSA
jgi:HAMP domain-containing protein